MAIGISGPLFVAGDGRSTRVFRPRGFGTSVRLDHEQGGRPSVRIERYSARSRTRRAAKSTRSAGDGDVSLEQEGEVPALNAGDSAHPRSVVPYSWSDNGSKEAVFVQAGTPRSI
jgi:hypothetical protein